MMWTVRFVFLIGVVAGLDTGFRLAPLGFNSWNAFGRDHTGKCKLDVDWCRDFDDAVVREVVQGMSTLGLQEAGYTYIGLDCGWTTGFRDAEGNQEVNTTKFPHGVKALADHVHSQGFKFGIYSSASEKQCCHSRMPVGANDGSLGYEYQDAQTYADWGVDYLKYDGCGGLDESYPRMRDGLNSTGRQIFLSENGYGPNGVNKTNDPRLVSNAWRTTGDDDVMWVEKLIAGAFQQDQWAELAGPGAFNDADMLEVGNPPLSESESRAHFSLWCAIKSPLIIGCDVTNPEHLGPGAIEILSNQEALAVNQDPLVKQAKVMWRSKDTVPQDTHKPRAEVPRLSVWTGPLQDGAYTALLLNAGTSPAEITLHRSMLWGQESGPAPILTVRDIWKHEDVASFADELAMTVPARDVVFLRLVPAQGEQFVA